jgi:phosphatidylglycerophosphate synthase
MIRQRRYAYDLSIKSEVSDELINVYLLRPAAGLLVRALYYTPVTPNQLTLAATVSGFLAAALYLHATPDTTIIAGVCMTLKDLLDSADGQLARAKEMYSRAGRFLDSIGDVLVNLSVFAAIGYALAMEHREPHYAVLAILGFLGITLRVSYHVYYQTSFLHLQQQYTTNRITEEIRAEDMQTVGHVLLLQRVFQLLYGWQDRLMVKIDGWCRKGGIQDNNATRWFADRIGLRLSGLLGLGTELFVLMVCSVTDQLTVYLYCNIGLMNGIWLASIWYRRRILAPRSLSHHI